MAKFPTPENPRRTPSTGSDITVEFTFNNTQSKTKSSAQLPPPEILAAPEEQQPLTLPRAPTHILWQRPATSSTLSPTRPLNIKNTPTPEPTPTPQPPAPATPPDTQTTTQDNIQAEKTQPTASTTQPTIPQAEPPLQATQPLPKTTPRTAAPPTTTPHKNNPPPPPPPPTTGEPTTLELEKIGAIPVPHRVNRQANEQKKLRGTLSLMAWSFSLAIIAILALAAYGGWEIWQRVTTTESLTGNINTELRAQLRDTNSRLNELETSLAETRATATTLSDLRREEAGERRLITETLATLTIRLEEIENTSTARLRSIALTEQEVQDIRKELTQIRTTLSTAQNRNSSDITTLQRRVEAIENFLTRATQRTEPQRR